jgi:hypothetical protein
MVNPQTIEKNDVLIAGKNTDYCTKSVYEVKSIDKNTEKLTIEDIQTEETERISFTFLLICKCYKEKGISCL